MSFDVRAALRRVGARHTERLVLAGVFARLTGRSHSVEVLNDACLLLQAREAGQVRLTWNVADFDLLQQLVPDARVLFYRRVASE